MSKKPSDRPSARKRPPHWDPASGQRPPLGAVDEAVVNAPSRQSLIVLGVICAATLVMWAAGRAACNYHVPGEGLTPREVTLKERVRNPKGVGVELAQALSGANFELAEKLVEPSARSLIDKARDQCGECELEKAARDSLLSVAEVLQASRTEAYVFVRTIGGPPGEVERVFHVKRDRSRKLPWKVTKAMPGRANLPELEGALPPKRTTSLNRPKRRRNVPSRRKRADSESPKRPTPSPPPPGVHPAPAKGDPSIPPSQEAADPDGNPTPSDDSGDQPEQ